MRTHQCVPQLAQIHLAAVVVVEGGECGEEFGRGGERDEEGGEVGEKEGEGDGGGEGESGIGIGGGEEGGEGLGGGGLACRVEREGVSGGCVWVRDGVLDEGILRALGG